jgi:hypothetical protein
MSAAAARRHRVAGAHAAAEPAIVFADDCAPLTTPLGRLSRFERRNPRIAGRSNAWQSRSIE